MKKISIISAVSTAVFGLSLVATNAVFAAENAATKGAEQVVLKWSGCGISQKAYMKELAKGYEAKTGVKIEISGGGATKGIRNVNEEIADLGGACRFKVPGTGLERQARLEPVGWDALVVVKHPDNPVNNITLDNLRKVYTGEITNWKELGGRDAEIKLLARVGKISGVGLAFRELAFGNRDFEFTERAKYVKSSGPVEKGAAKDINAMGVSGISSAKRREGVAIMNLDGVEPTYDNIKNGTYQMYRPLYLVYNLNDERKEVKDFIAYAHSKEGRDIIRGAGTVPYLEALPLVLKAVDERKNVVPYEIKK